MQETRCGFDPWVWKIPQRRKWQPTPVLLPGESHGQRSLVGYSPWGRKESDTLKWLNYHHQRNIDNTGLSWWPTNISSYFFSFSSWRSSLCICSLMGFFRVWPKYLLYAPLSLIVKALHLFPCLRGFPGSSVGKESVCNAGDRHLIPGLGRSAGEGIGYPLQYSWASLVAQLVKRIHLQCRRPGFDPWVRKIPWRREGLPTAVFWPGECHGGIVHGVAKTHTWLSDFHFHFPWLWIPYPYYLYQDHALGPPWESSG